MYLTALWMGDVVLPVRTSMQSLPPLQKSIFRGLSQNYKRYEQLTLRALLAPINDDVLSVHQNLQSELLGNEATLKSHGSVIGENDA